MAILNGKYRVKNSQNNYDIVYLETGANQVKFDDGKTFQQKLDEGTLKGEKGDTGAKGDKGEKGETGAKGADGLTTSVTVNGVIYSHNNGNITLPNYPTLSSLGGASTAVATTSTNGLMSAEDKTKLNSIATNSQFKITVASSSWTADGSLYSTTINHNLNKEVLYVSAYDSSSKKSIFVSYTITNNNSLKVTVESAINAVITIVVEGGITNLASGGISDSTVSATSTWSSTKIESAMNGLVKDGTTDQKGIVQLSSAIDSTSTTLGATASAVKVAYDLANTANNTANTANNTANTANNTANTANNLANTIKNSVNYNRTITMSTSDPSGGKNGDIWFKYE